MGVQIQCAQCHVHPSVEKWNQKDFWGLAAFFGHTRIEREGGGKNNKKGGLATVHETEAGQGGKGNKGKGKGARPVPAGPVINIPDPNDTKKVTGTARARFFEGEYPNLGSKGPYRPTLAAWLTSPENPYFAPCRRQPLLGALLLAGLCQSAGGNARQESALAPGLAPGPVGRVHPVEL